MTTEHRPKTGVRAAGVSAAIVLAFALTGCETNAPVAAPTSTLPAPAEPTPTVPAYETELDLSAEEKEAVEGALLALEGYILALNEAFSSGGVANTKIEEFARSDALKAFKEDTQSLKENGEYMAGEFKLLTRQVHAIEQNRSHVTVLSCVDNAAFSRIKHGDEFKQLESEYLTVEFAASIADGTWKVDSQGLWSEECER